MPHVVLLIGLPGVGKLTVAKHLVRLMADGGETVRLVDNHYADNVIFGLLDTDGETPLGAEVWGRIFEVHEAVHRTIEEHSPPDWSFVLTAAVEAGDEWFLDRVGVLAERRASRYTIVQFRCDLEELERRIAAPGRAEYRKMTSVAGIRELYEREPPSLAGHEVISIDTTHQDPEAAAVEILAGLGSA